MTIGVSWSAIVTVMALGSVEELDDDEEVFSIGEWVDVDGARLSTPPVAEIPCPFSNRSPLGEKD